MRPTKAIASCAVAALAMVFSVQQGQHGPLVVYKLEVPSTSAPAAALSATTVSPPGTALRRPSLPGTTLDRVVMPQVRPTPALPAKAPRLSPLEPTVLGTVVMPVSHSGVPQADTAAPAPMPAPVSLLPQDETAAPVELDPLAFGRLYRGAPLDVEDSAMVNPRTGERLTLETVNTDIAWRRETAEKLRHLPVGPRF